MFGDRVGPIVPQNSCYVGALGHGASRVESTSRLGVGFPTLIQCPAPPTYSSRLLTASPPEGWEGRGNRNYLLCALRGKKKKESHLLPPGLFLSPHPLSSSEFVSFHHLALHQLRCFQKSPPCSPLASDLRWPYPQTPSLGHTHPFCSELSSSLLFICSHCCFLTALPSSLLSRIPPLPSSLGPHPHFLLRALVSTQSKLPVSSSPSLLPPHRLSPLLRSIPVWPRDDGGPGHL